MNTFHPCGSWLVAAYLLLIACCVVAGSDPVMAADQARARRDFAAAARLYREALRQQPGNGDLMMALAAVLGYRGRFDESRALYESVLREHPGRLDALNGCARLLWWQNRPYAALRAYRQVLALDPHNETATAAVSQIGRSVALQGSVTVKSVDELEEGTTWTGTVYPFQAYRLNKRLTDRVELHAGYFHDYSSMRYRNPGAGIDTMLRRKRFEPFMLRPVLIFGGQRFDCHLAYNLHDAELTGYGCAWQGAWSLGRLSLRNTLGAGYDCFYHWSNAGRDYGEDVIRLELGRWAMEGLVRYAVVRNNGIMESGPAGDTLFRDGTNPYRSTQTALTCRFFNAPTIRLVLAHDYSHYTFGSSRYFTPHNRHLFFTGSTVNGIVGRFGYALEMFAGYDRGGTLFDGSNAPNGLYYRGDLGVKCRIGPATVGTGVYLYVNPRYEARVYRAELSF